MYHRRLRLGCFFFEMVRKFIEGYGTLFNKTDEEDVEEGEEQDNKKEDNGDHSEFGEKWKWISLVDRVSSTVRESWEKVFNMNVYEFFNILCYSIDKANDEKRRMDLWKQKH